MTVRERILQAAGLPPPPQPQQPRVFPDDIVFQVIAWHALDVSEDRGDGECSDDDQDDAGADRKRAADAYTINAFGVTPRGRSVCVRVRGFPPFFYVKVPADLGRGPRRAAAVQALADMLAGSDMRLRVEAATPLHKRDFWGFNGGETFDFVRLRFRTLRDMRIAASKISKRTVPVQVRGFGSAQLALYESNMDPLLRFLHVQQLQPAGWVKIAARSAVRLAGHSTCDVTYDCAWKHMLPHPDPPACIAPMVLASFDIECASAHGDFPVAKKDYRRLAIDVVQAWERRSLRAAGEYVAATAVERVILEAFGVEPPGPDRVARLHIKGLGGASLDAADSAEVRRLAKRHAGDLVSILRGSLQQQQQQQQQPKNNNAGPWWVSGKGTAAVADGGAVDVEGGGDGEDEEDTSTLGVLTSTLNAVFERRWPLEGDAIIQIGMTIGVYGAPTCVAERHVLVLGTCDEVPGAEVRTFEREEDLLLAWVDLVREVDPDVLVGYNVFGFDMAYMHGRAQELFGQMESEDRFCRIGRLEDLPSPFVEQRLSSSALGDNVLRYLDAQGRVGVDLMKVVQRDHRLDSYKLDSVAEHFLKTRKHDVSPQDIFRLQRGSSADRAVIAAYCVQDCELCNLLAAKLETLANNVGMANVCWVPLSFIFMRGQGVKIFSLVAKRCREDGMLIPTRSRPVLGAGPTEGGEGDDEEGYEGAIVLEPQVGLYLDDPVSVLDYNSLYPSSMISHNLSHDSLVLDVRYGRLPGVAYVEVRYDRYEGKGDDRRIVGECTCRFARRGNGDGPEDAVLPRILRDLLAHRKATRKRLAELPEGPEHDFQRAVLDGQQLAYKVTANSLYGQMGARTSPLYLKQVAACTTAVGRQMILQAKAYVEEVAGGRVVYGDSVPGYTPVAVRIRGGGDEESTGCVWWCARARARVRRGVAVLAIDDVERHVDVRAGWHDCGGGKEALELEEGAAEVLDSTGMWVPLLRVIRHRLPGNRQLVEARSRRAVVHVTDEHSLLLADATPVSASQVCDGTQLLHVRPGALRVAWDDLHSSMHGIRDDMRPFFESFLANPDDVEVQVSVRRENQVNAARFAFVASACAGLDDVELLDSADGRWLRVCVHKPGRKIPDSGEAAKVRPVASTGPATAYVYDLTTATHRFQAGVGTMVVHNTDSIFVVFDNHGLTGRDALASSIRQGQQVSSGIHPHLPQPHKLAYEKTLFPMGLLNKKRYFGLLYEDDPDDPNPKQKSMGIALKRRDYAPIVKQLYGGVIDIILRDRDVPRAVEFLRRRLVDLAEGIYDLDDLVISKTLRSYYKLPHQIAHCVLARRMYDRDPGSAPQANDRVPYVFVETSKRNALMGDRIEHVDYVRSSLKPGAGRRPVRVDTKLYIQNQLLKPCVQLLAIALEQIPGYVPQPQLTGPRALDALVVQKQGNMRKARERLDALREREVEALIFAPVLARDVFRERDNRCGGQMEITAFLGRPQAGRPGT